jgi:hypothetical protein
MAGKSIGAGSFCLSDIADVTIDISNESILNYVAENFNPIDVFGPEALCKWAEENDFVERSDL